MLGLDAAGKTSEWDIFDCGEKQCGRARAGSANIWAGEGVSRERALL